MPPSHTLESTPESHLLPHSRFSLREHGPIVAFFALYAILLAFLSLHHELYVDEAQAWLIVKNSSSFADLLHHLRYEGHPALWYLLIWIPAHLSTHVEWIQAINYTLSLAFAGLLLTETRIQIGQRVLLLFSVMTLIYMGDVARSYTLAALFLVGATRCFLSRKHWLAVVLLALAINTHFLAITIAGCIFIWFYWLKPASESEAQLSLSALAFLRLKQRRFQLSTAILGFALLLCYATLRPAADIATPHYDHAKATHLDYLVSAIGIVWRYFLPQVNADATAIPFHWVGVNGSATLLDAVITIVFWLLAVAVLPTRRGRQFMISASVLWTLAVTATVHLPSPFHASFLFIAFVIALMAGKSHSQPAEADRAWLPHHYAELLLMVLLSLQVAAGLADSVYEALYDFSGAKATAQFLARSGLTNRLLIIQPDLAAPALLAYTNVPSAYLPGCRCQARFIVFQRDWTPGRRLTVAELEQLRSQSATSPILLTNPALSEADRKAFGLKLIYTSPQGWYWDQNDVSVYATETQADENRTTTASNPNP